MTSEPWSLNKSYPRQSTRWCPSELNRDKLVNSSLQFHLGLWGLLYIYIYSFHGDYKPTNITGGVPPGMFNVSGTCFFLQIKNCPDWFQKLPWKYGGFPKSWGYPNSSLDGLFQFISWKIPNKNRWMRTGGSPFVNGNLHMVSIWIHIHLPPQWTFQGCPPSL